MVCSGDAIRASHKVRKAKEDVQRSNGVSVHSLETHVSTCGMTFQDDSFTEEVSAIVVEVGDVVGKTPSS